MIIQKLMPGKSFTAHRLSPFHWLMDYCLSRVFGRIQLRELYPRGSDSAHSAFFKTGISCLGLSVFCMALASDTPLWRAFSGRIFRGIVPPSRGWQMLRRGKPLACTHSICS